MTSFSFKKKEKQDWKIFIWLNFLVLLASCFFFAPAFSATVNPSGVPKYLGSPYLKRSPKGLLLGDAFVGRADDEFTLFYNPAALGRHNGISIFPINVYGGTNDILRDKDQFTDLPDEPVAFSDRFMNYPVHGNLGGAPGFKLGTFGISLLYNVELNAIVSNTQHPVLDLNYRYDQGFATGIAIPLYPKKNGQTFSLGLGTKYLRRDGLADRFSLLSPKLINVIADNENWPDAINALGKNTAKAWGFDMGLEYAIQTSVSETVIGFSALDIYTKFKIPEGSSGTMPEQLTTYNFGLAQKFKLPFFELAMSGDVAPINSAMPMKEMLHLGLELATPLIHVLAGWNASGFSYGAQLNLFLFKVVGGFYHDKIGYGELMIRQQRMVIFVSLLDFSFDGW
ncbi:MAG: hypothetical protein QE271_05135 [Bacteriovoracaceae bacterium]|nr:hypothetical protein [Bacteriovoracaceae bacterium]